MKRLKVIQIAHASHSYFADKDDDLKKITLNDWYSKTAEQLKKFYPEIEVECWAPEKLNKKESNFTEFGVLFRFFPVNFSPIYALDFSIKMLKELKKEIDKSKNNGYDLIIHLHEYHNLHGLLIASFFKKQKIITQHHGGSCPLKHLKEKKKYWCFFPFFIIGEIWENFVLKNINVFYALSKGEIEYLKKIAPKSKIKFQTMGIENEYFHKFDKKIARKKLKIKENKKIIIYVGRINSIKGIKFLLDAMKKLTGVELYLLGYGNEKEFFQNYAEKNNIKNVKFLGGVFGEKKLLYLSSADALILPSSKEGAPVTAMEAIAMNLPVIVTNVGGVSLMIRNGREGIIIKPKNSEEIVMAVRSILKWKKRDIRKYANKYKWKKIIKETVDDYTKLAS